VLPNLFGIRKFVHEIKSRLPLRVGAKNLDNFTVVFHDNAFQLENVDVEMGYLLNNRVESPLSLPSGDQIIMSESPTVETAATAVRLGTFENGFGPYSDLGR